MKPLEDWDDPENEKYLKPCPHCGSSCYISFATWGIPEHIVFCHTKKCAYFYESRFLEDVLKHAVNPQFFEEVYAQAEKDGLL